MSAQGTTVNTHPGRPPRRRGRTALIVVIVLTLLAGAAASVFYAFRDKSPTGVVSAKEEAYCQPNAELVVYYAPAADGLSLTRVSAQAIKVGRPPYPGETSPVAASHYGAEIKHKNRITWDPKRFRPIAVFTMVTGAGATDYYYPFKANGATIQAAPPNAWPKHYLTVMGYDPRAPLGPRDTVLRGCE